MDECQQLGVRLFATMIVWADWYTPKNISPSVKWYVSVWVRTNSTFLLESRLTIPFVTFMSLIPLWPFSEPVIVQKDFIFSNWRTMSGLTGQFQKSFTSMASSKIISHWQRLNPQHNSNRPHYTSDPLSYELMFVLSVCFFDKSL